MNCRVLKSGRCAITQEYKTSHKAIDLVKEGYMLDDITAHSEGRVIQVINSCNVNTPNDSSNPGNMVKIDHGNGYVTRYLHLAYGTVKVKVGDYVSKGQVLGYMGNTGHSFGGHLHFELYKNNERINPLNYLNSDLPKEEIKKATYSVGDEVTINGVYVSSISDTKLTPAVTKGTITKIVAGARNPYLLNDGNIGWINESCIVTCETSHKDNYEVAQEVIRGLWGNGEERKKRLTEAGYNYSDVQSIVNRIFGK